MSGLGGAAVYQRTEFGNNCMTAFGRMSEVANDCFVDLQFADSGFG